MIAQIAARFRAKRIILLFVVMSIAGMALMWIHTPWGIGVGYDSVFYLSAANNLLNGFGLSRLDAYHNVIPLTHYPPLYPLILAAISFIIKLPTDVVARWVSVGMFGVNIYLIGWLIYRYTRSEVAGVLAALAAVTSPLLVDVHLMAMTEPLYLAFMMLTLHFLQQYIETAKWPFGVIAALMTALAYSTRYIGLTLVATGGLLILMWGRRPFWLRVKDALLFGTIGIAPILGWYFRNWRVAGTMNNRTILFHPPKMQKIIGGISTISQWFFPGVVSGQWRTVGLVLVLLIFSMLTITWLLRLRKNVSDSDAERTAACFVGVLVLHLFAYLAMLGASLTLFDASTRLNDRILSPVYVLLVLVIFILVWLIPVSRIWKILRFGFLGGFLLWVGMSAMSTNQIYAIMQQDGKGFTGCVWQTSETVDAVRDLPEDALIFSNEAFLIYYLTGRPANWIPENIDVVKQQASEEYFARLSEMQRAIEQSHGYLVVFDTIEEHWVYPSLDEMTSGLVLLEDFDDGVIYVGP